MGLVKKIFSAFTQLGRQSSEISKLAEEDRQWAVSLRVYEREQAVKICAYLAKTIGAKYVSEKGLSIGIQGGIRRGKSLLCDVFAYAFIDDKNPYHVERADKMFIEDYPDQAIHGRLSKDFTLNGSSTLVMFENFGLIESNFWYYDDDEEKQKKEKLDIISYNFCNVSNVRKPSLSDVSGNFKFDLVIKLNQKGMGIWHSEWNIYIAPHLRSDEMKIALEHLRGVGERLTARRKKDYVFA